MLRGWEVTADLVESIGNLQSPGLQFRVPASWLPTTGIGSRPVHSFRLRYYVYLTFTSGDVVDRKFSKNPQRKITKQKRKGRKRKTSDCICSYREQSRIRHRPSSRPLTKLSCDIFQLSGNAEEMKKALSKVYIVRFGHRPPARYRQDRLHYTAPQLTRAQCKYLQKRQSD